jgi:hypothetical protein
MDAGCIQLGALSCQGPSPSPCPRAGPGGNIFSVHAVRRLYGGDSGALLEPGLRCDLYLVAGVRCLRLISAGVLTQVCDVEEQAVVVALHLLERLAALGGTPVVTPVRKCSMDGWIYISQFKSRSCTCNQYVSEMLQ